MRSVYSFDNENGAPHDAAMIEQQKLAALQEIALQLTAIARKLSDQNSMLVSLAASLSAPQQHR